MGVGGELEKVKVTEEQAKAIEWALGGSDVYKNNPDALLSYMSFVKWKECPLGEGLKSLGEISIPKLAKALYIGYEIEPEFEVGDWVKFEYLNGTVIYGQVDTTAFDDIIANFSNGVRHRYHKSKVKQMTPEEILQEKERRWWAENGREVWGLKKGDVLIDDYHNMHEVTDKCADLKGYYLDYVSCNFDEMIQRYKVLVFAENRLDK